MTAVEPDRVAPYIRRPRVAYFSMEIALEDQIPTYAGGLGILAGDTMRSAADLQLPMVAVTLVSRAGYFRQILTADGVQTEQPDQWQPERHATLTDAKVSLRLEGRRVWVQAWLYEVRGQPTGAGGVPVLLLDTDVADNTIEDRRLTHHLYGGGDDYRLKQEAVLGVGGVRMLYALGFQIRQYHLNEGHAALLAVELAKRAAYEQPSQGSAPFDLARVRAQCNFTTHTPVEAGHDQFSYELVTRILGDRPELAELKQFGGHDRLNMTRLALNFSDYVNGVAKRHAEVSRTMFPGYRVHAVSNGVHPYTWTAEGFSRLFNQHLPGWCYEPEVLVRADQLPDDAVWHAHAEAKQALIDLVAEQTGVRFDGRLLTIGFARRMTAYKRPELLFSDLEVLRRLAEAYPLQIVLAGKAHPKDSAGKQLIIALHRICTELRGAIPAVFLRNYDMALARRLVSGVDLWLNTPRPPMEASGTSGMKAGFNGVPSLSALDGWWVEGCVSGVTGWAIDPRADASDRAAAAALYAELGEQILPLYYRDRSGWISVMKGAISKNASRFNSHRMLRRYVSDAYFD